MVLVFAVSKLSYLGKFDRSREPNEKKLSDDSNNLFREKKRFLSPSGGCGQSENSNAFLVFE